MNGTCQLCGLYTAQLERHHIFGGAYRKKSERYKLTTNLCHDCHNEPPCGVHHNANAMLALKQQGQQQAMREQQWSTADFIREFGKNYL